MLPPLPSAPHALSWPPDPSLPAPLPSFSRSPQQAGQATRAVKPEEVEALASKHRAHVFETSAKQGDGVGEIFSCIVAQYHARANAGDGASAGGRGNNLQTGAATQRSGCC